MRYAKGYFEDLPNDFGRGHLPKPPIEAGFKAVQYLKKNALPLLSVVVAVIGFVLI